VYVLGALLQLGKRAQSSACFFEEGIVDFEQETAIALNDQWIAKPDVRTRFAGRFGTAVHDASLIITPAILVQTGVETAGHSSQVTRQLVDLLRRRRRVLQFSRP